MDGWMDVVYSSASCSRVASSDELRRTYIRVGGSDICAGLSVLRAASKRNARAAQPEIQREQPIAKRARGEIRDPSVER